ncbi:AMP-binding protein [Pseudonocardia sp. N23]|uniref:AMP-binding protein n=1 Tax=Pseudonocardia sp. N23 TaxID=1987376 RepID=UPI000BFC7EAF|nr:AMP-binding protein [Pseudonocardia sp. N23]GAY08941.1 O-succinylbenzoic acid--CoA ligase [Pseudonocardia sp. N23]
MQSQQDEAFAAGGADAPTHLADLVRRAARRTPDATAIVDVSAGTSLTWAEFDAAVDDEADRLRTAGAGPGDRVVIALDNGAPLCVALFGALRIDAVAVPVAPRSVPRELDAVLTSCSPSVVVAASDGRIAESINGRSTIVSLAPPDVSSAGGARSGRERSVSGKGVERVADGPETGHGGEAIALVVYTSGTTGTPRGVMLSHRALLANRVQQGAVRPAPVTPVDRVLLSLPLFHVFGLAAGLLQVCHAGATVVLTRRFDPEQSTALLADERISVVGGVPSMYRALLDLPADRLRDAFAGVRLCTSGGAPLPREWLAAFREATGLDLYEGYGLSECGPVLTSALVGGRAKPGSVGAPLPGVELRLVDIEGVPISGRATPEDAEQEMEDGSDDEDTGLVATRGPHLFSGYWPDGHGGPDADGWFRTADVGYLDADGDLHLVDRSSDLVIVNGFNVYPREVEQVLAELDTVAEAAVVGVPDDRSGEAVKAVVVRAGDAELTEDDVVAHCRARLARFKVPAVVEFVDALPRTPTGKVARRRL